MFYKIILILYFQLF